MSIDEFEVRTKTSGDEMRRWHKRGLISFDPDCGTEFDDRHQIEVEFVAALLRSGLGDAWIERILEHLPKPYCYSTGQTFYSFAHGQWVTIPPERDVDDIINEHLDELAEAKDWAGLRDLCKRIEDLIPTEEMHEQE